MSKQSEILLKGYTVHQVEHEILRKYYLAYIGTVRALEHTTQGNFNSAYDCLNWARRNLEEVKQRFPDILDKAVAFEEGLRQARNALSLLEKKLEGDPQHIQTNKK